MPLIEVEPNVLLDPATGVRIVHVPGVKVVVHSIDGGSYDFRAPTSDPATVWAAIRAHVAPQPGPATAFIGAVEDLHRSLSERLAAVEGHIDDADGEDGLAERLAAIEGRLGRLESEVWAMADHVPADGPARRPRRFWWSDDGGKVWGTYYPERDRWVSDTASTGLGVPVTPAGWLDPEPVESDGSLDPADIITEGPAS